YVWNFISSSQKVVHCKKDLVYVELLQGDIDPRHVSVVKLGRIAPRKSWLVVHSGSPPIRDVRPVLPRAVLLDPLFVGHQDVKHPREPVLVTGDQEVLPLTPGKDIGACTGKVEAMKLFRPVGFVDLPADVAVAVLLSIKVLKRLL